MSDEDPRELLIIRKRHSVEDEDHHGGVWKLAFADFMTAMMAFFLVMWLINSTTKETKATIVQYFNPVQLVDSNPARKGLRDPQDSGQAKIPPRPLPESKPSQTMPNKEKSGPLHEAELLYDPMATLDEIASSNPGGVDPAASASVIENRPPVFGDPFDRIDRGAKDLGQHDDERTKPVEKPLESNRTDDSEATVRQVEQSVSLSTGAKPISRQQRSDAPGVDEKPKSEPNVASIRAEVEKILKRESADLRKLPHVEVAESDEGVLINLTDDANFSMFAVGSVEPKPQLVRILGQIGRILAQRPSEIELRGHTDARSYKSATYDNWRLSSARANMAFYMLVRGGLAERRVVKISGFADRRLKTPKDPLAANNRRIEILLRRGDH